MLWILPIFQDFVYEINLFAYDYEYKLFVLAKFRIGYVKFKVTNDRIYIYHFIQLLLALRCSYSYSLYPCRQGCKSRGGMGDTSSSIFDPHPSNI